MFYGVELRSRLLLGTARYPSPAVLERAIKASGAHAAQRILITDLVVQ